MSPLLRFIVITYIKITHEFVVNFIKFVMSEVYVRMFGVNHMFEVTKVSFMQF